MKMKIPSETTLKNVRLEIDTLQRLYVELDMDLVSKLEDEGWHFWHEDSKAYLIVAVNALNPVEILTGQVDLVIVPYAWKVGSRSGVKAFIQSITPAETSESA